MPANYKCLQLILVVRNAVAFEVSKVTGYEDSNELKTVKNYACLGRSVY